MIESKFEKQPVVDENSKTFGKTDYSKSDESADFETAISKTGFGSFNLLLFFVSMVSTLASQSEISVLSFAFPAAQCDLDITLEGRGLINAVIFAGMMVSSFVWGPLADVFGRKKILIITHFLDYIFALMAAFAPNVVVLIVAKFFGGFIINGPMLSLLSYASEFHGIDYRPKVALACGMLYNFGSVIIPLLAWVILPLDINSFGIHSWNVFLFICSTPSLLTSIIFIFMPESPKFLMSQGNNEKALEVFQKIYKSNKRKPTEHYPIKKLINDQQISNEKPSFKGT